MAEGACCGIEKGLEISNMWYAPEELLRQKMGGFYESHPVMARVLIVPLFGISGAVKTFLFPVIAVVGVLVQPIIAGVRKFQGKEDSGNWLQAWGFSLLATAGLLGFALVGTYCCPLIGLSAIVVAAVAASITVHVYRALQSPPRKVPDIFKDV